MLNGAPLPQRHDAFVTALDSLVRAATGETLDATIAILRGALPTDPAVVAIATRTLASAGHIAGIASLVDDLESRRHRLWKRQGMSGHHADPLIDAAIAERAWRTHPYYASALQRLRITADDNVPTMATSSSWVTHYNPATVKGWTTFRDCGRARARIGTPTAPTLRPLRRPRSQGLERRGRCRNQSAAWPAFRTVRSTPKRSGCRAAVRRRFTTPRPVKASRASVGRWRWLRAGRRIAVGRRSELRQCGRRADATARGGRRGQPGRGRGR
jgi:hypothetical protein